MLGGVDASLVACGNRPDLTGDGKNDLVWRRRDSGGELALWEVNGVGVTQRTVIGGLESGWSVAGAGDFDADGKDDLVFRNENGAASLWRMDGSTVLGRDALDASDASLRLTKVGDYNGDGKADVLWSNDAGVLAIWLMNGPMATGRNVVRASRGGSRRIFEGGKVTFSAAPFLSAD